MSARTSLVRRVAGTMALALLLASSGIALATAQQSITVVASADTWVGADRPSAAHGDDTLLFADGHGPRTTLLRFDVAVPTGQVVIAASLVMHATDSAPQGAAVSTVSSTTWDEASTTWLTRPAVDGAVVATLPAQQAGTSVVADVSSAITGSGTVTLALTNPSLDDATFASRESAQAPALQLVVEDAPAPPAQDLDGVTEVLPAPLASSDPTATALNRRLAVSSGGRRLAVVGLHARGVALAWRDVGSQTWARASTGASGEGVLLDGTGTGDWTASIAVGPDRSGVEHAWVVMARDNFNNAAYGVYLVRLDNLDAAAGPTVGPRVTLDAPPLSAKQADVAVDLSQPDGPHVAVVYTGSFSEASRRVIVGWLDSVDTPTPTLVSKATLVDSAEPRRYGSLAPTPAGMRVVTRGTKGYTTVWAHAPAAPLATWTQATARGLASVGGANAVNGVALDDGSVVITGQPDGAVDTVVVERMSASGQAVTPIARLDGYRHPVVTGDGTQVWLVAIRASDGAVVSRRWSADGGLSTTDAVELTAQATGNNAQWPSVPAEVTDTLLVLSRGAHQADGATRTTVVASARRL